MTPVYDESAPAPNINALTIPCPICGSSDVVLLWAKPPNEEHRAIARRWRCSCGTRLTTYEALSSAQPPNAVAEIIMRDPQARVSSGLTELFYRIDKHVALMYRGSKHKAGRWYAKSLHPRIVGAEIGMADDLGFSSNNLSFDQALASPKIKALSERIARRNRENQDIYAAMKAVGKIPEDHDVYVLPDEPDIDAADV